MNKHDIDLKEKIAKIKLVIMDVDGVLTDGGLYYTSEGLIMKKFNVKDGMGVYRLREAGIDCGIITTDDSELVFRRGDRLKLSFTYIGVLNKEQRLNEICQKRNINFEEVAFIGDDLNDEGIIKSAGLSACPSDAVSEIQDIVDIVLTKKGGEGAFREFAEIILEERR